MTGGPAGPGRAGGVRRSWLAVGALVAGLLAMRAAAPFVAPPTADAPAAGPAGDLPGPVAVPLAAGAARPAPLAEATGTSLLLGGDGGLLRVDLDRGRVRPVPLPVGAAEADRRPARATGDPARPGLLRPRLGLPRPGVADRGDRRPRALVPAARARPGSL